MILMDFSKTLFFCFRNTSGVIDMLYLKRFTFVKGSESRLLVAAGGSLLVAALCLSWYIIAKCQLQTEVRIILSENRLT